MKNILFIAVPFSLFLVSLSVAQAFGPNNAVCWTDPLTNTDGTPVVQGDIATYKIYVGTTSGQYTRTFQFGIGKTAKQASGERCIQFRTIALDFPSGVNGTFFIAMTAIDGSNNESLKSNEFSFAYKDPALDTTPTTSPAKINIK